ncbi:MAG: HobA family DNA replication regulator, partial [Campylobacterota bacterium]|nr:HobA family DNA replication regulator [Campylobacterota bacterium]
MSDFAQWSLDVIREDGAILSWLEEQRFDWTNPLSLALEQILNGKTIILITDEKRKWLETYILGSINSMQHERPLLPIVSIDSLYKHYGS